MCAPRAVACSNSSSTSTAAPSAITNPSRDASNGRDARDGSPFRLESARIAPKPAIATDVIGASVPPQNITSARPRRIASLASPIAMFDAAQAVDSASSGPLAPSSIETEPAGRFGSVCTIAKGLTLSTPFAASRRTHSWNDSTAERARDRHTDALGAGGQRRDPNPSRPDEPPQRRCAQRSMRRAVFRST
jgi:hypothetical protein